MRACTLAAHGTYTQVQPADWQQKSRIPQFDI